MSNPGYPGAPEQVQQEEQGTKISLVSPVHKFIYRGIAGGIGLASEAINHSKAKRIAAKERNASGEIQGTESREELVAQTEHEANWALDEAQDDLRYPSGPPSYADTIDNDAAIRAQQLLQAAETSHQEDISHVADRFIENHPLPIPEPIAQPEPATDEAGNPIEINLGGGRIALPVLLTQRRPGKRSRGFIRAYAPVLEDAGITEAAFLDFIDDMNKAVEPNGLIQAMNLASLAGIAIASPTAIALSIGLQLATHIGDEVHSRTKTNSFIDMVNEQFFAPRGLVAAVLTWKPSQKEEYVMTSFDGEEAITEAMDARQQEHGAQKFGHKFQASAGIAPCEWPETAPLIFPDLDRAAGDEANKANVFKRSSNFVTEYWDRRARAKWAGRNPDSLIAKGAPQESFTSKFSDPNHPASSGDPLALFTGGRAQMPSITLPKWGKKNKNPLPQEQVPVDESNPDASGAGLRRAENPLVPLLSGGLTLLHQVRYLEPFFFATY